MCDIFVSEDVQKLLDNKLVVVIGDSNQRAVYKDLVLLLQNNMYLSEKHLKKKGEESFLNDKLIEGGVLGAMTNGTEYREVREYHTNRHLVHFYFVTRCYSEYVETILEDFSHDPKPDVVIMNSCLWDITRYGCTSVGSYKENLVKLFTRFKEVLSPECLVIWSCALPIANTARGGVIIPEIQFLNETLRLDIMEANFYARQVAVEFGYDVLDLHYYFRRHIDRRARDGVHWDMRAHRRITNFLFSHICEAWGVGLPGRNGPVTYQINSSDRRVEKLSPQVGSFPRYGYDEEFRKPLISNSCNLSLARDRHLSQHGRNAMHQRSMSMDHAVLAQNSYPQLMIQRQSMAEMRYHQQQQHNMQFGMAAQMAQNGNFCNRSMMIENVQSYKPNYQQDYCETMNTYMTSAQQSDLRLNLLRGRRYQPY